jgi:hypothetical protein
MLPRRPVTPFADVAALERLSLVELRSKWAEHYGAVPALRSPDLLRLILAWRLQAREHGGLDPAIRRKLKRTGPVLAEGLRLGPGTRLIREWDGGKEEILVEKNGFRWLGNSYPSLSAIALAMTGTRRNGPRFFGLRGKSR